MNYRKTAEKIIDLICDVRVDPREFDNVGYYVAHLGTPEIWKRAQHLGESMMYHSATMAEDTREQRENEQLCLPLVM